MERRKLIELARKIQANFKSFYLAGGTALYLKYNHRYSEDLDFFKQKPFSFNRISSKLRKLFKVSKEERFTDNIDFIVENVKVSFIFFPFKNIDRLETFEGIKKASDYDIFLNKIYSAGRRIESKDVLDFVFLYEKYRWDWNMVKRDFEMKFPDQSFEIYLGAMLSVEDYPDLDNRTKSKLKEIIKEIESWIN